MIGAVYLPSAEDTNTLNGTKRFKDAKAAAVALAAEAPAGAACGSMIRFRDSVYVARQGALWLSFA